MTSDDAAEQERDGYHDYIEQCARDCRCCFDCHQDVPCAGVMAGGFCDRMCRCVETDEYERDDYDDDE